MIEQSAPLHGLRILNTRPHKSGKQLSSEIRQYGGVSIDLPTLEIKDCGAGWLKELPKLHKVHYAIFISANAVEYCFALIAQHSINWPPSIKVIAIGQATASALEHHQIRVDETPILPDSEHILDLPCLQQIEEKIIVLFKGKGGRLLIEETLRKRVAQLYTLPVYLRSMPPLNYYFTNSLWQEDAVDIILVTSEQSIQNLFKLFSQEAHGWLHNKPFLVISKRLAEVASFMGIKKITISHPNRIINTLFDYKDYLHAHKQKK